jgi:DNA-binding response OmpR family regulator
MVDKGMASERGELAKWLEKSRFLSCDAVNVFEAMEEVADYTVRDRPDVIVLDVECCSESVDLVRNVFAASRVDSPILTLTKKPEKCLDLRALSAHLNNLIPEKTPTH